MERIGLSQALLAAVVSAAALIASQAQAGTIVVQDNFSVIGTNVPLNGHVASNGQAWNDTGIGTIATSGTLTVLSPGAAANLLVTITPGAVYDLTADLTATAGWVGIGFQSGNSTGNIYGNQVAPWVFNKTAGDPGWGQVAGFAADSTAAQFLSDYSGSATHHVDIRLDTTGAQWTVGVYLDNSATPAVSNGDGLSGPGTYTYTTNPAIDHIAVLGGWTGGGTIQNLVLTSSAVPEPASLALLGLGALGLLRRRNHKA